MPAVQFGQDERANSTWSGAHEYEAKGSNVTLAIDPGHSDFKTVSIFISKVVWRASLTSIGASALSEEALVTLSTPMHAMGLGKSVDIDCERHRFSAVLPHTFQWIDLLLSASWACSKTRCLRVAIRCCSIVRVGVRSSH